MHHEKNFHECVICYARFKWKLLLKYHYLKHIEYKPHVCNVCKLGFNSKFCLNKHSRIHSIGKSYKCQACNKYFSKCTNLLKHICTLRANLFECKVCRDSFRTQELLSKHELIHKNEFRCVLCDMKFFSVTALKDHCLLHTGKDVVCKICKWSFSEVTEFSKHVCTDFIEKPFVCEICKCNFIEKSFLDNHRQIHAEKSFSKHEEINSKSVPEISPAEVNKNNFLPKAFPSKPFIDKHHIQAEDTFSEHEVISKSLSKISAEVYKNNPLSIAIPERTFLGKHYHIHAEKALPEHEKVKSKSLSKISAEVYKNNPLSIAIPAKTFLGKHCLIHAEKILSDHKEINSNSLSVISSTIVNNNNPLSKEFPQKNCLQKNNSVTTKSPAESVMVNSDVESSVKSNNTSSFTELAAKNLRRIHVRKYECPLCHHFFTQNVSLTRHMCAHNRNSLNKLKLHNANIRTKKWLEEHISDDSMSKK